MNVRYEATGALPTEVPAAVVARRGEVLILVNRSVTVDELCAALTPLITAHAQACWVPGQAIA